LAHVTAAAEELALTASAGDEAALFSAARRQSPQARAQETQRSPDREANHPTLPPASKLRQSTGSSLPPLRIGSPTTSSTEMCGESESTSPCHTPPPAMRYTISDSDRDIDDHFRRYSSRQGPSPPGSDLGWGVRHRPQLSKSRSEGFLTDLTPSQARVLRQQQRLQSTEGNSQAPTDTHGPVPEGEHVSTYWQMAAVAGPPQPSTGAVGPNQTVEEDEGPIQPYQSLIGQLMTSASENSFFDLLADEEQASLGGATAPGRSARYVYEQYRLSKRDERRRREYSLQEYN